MLPIYTQPRTSATHTTLQATGKTWRDLVRTLEVNNQGAYASIISPFLREAEDDATIRITFMNNVATKILHLIGLSS